MNARICLATVTTDSYIVGTLVTLHSFLAANAWFDGDVIVIARELSDESKRRLALVHPRIRHVQPGHELVERIARVAEILPEYATHMARFLSLEAFRLTDYDRVLVCDSDLLFRGSIEDLFGRSEPLIACGDRGFYTGERRPWLAEGASPVSFNSGLVLADRSCVSDEHYRGLIDLVSQEQYRRPHMTLADQIVLNLHFAGQATIVGPRYNYLLAHEGAIRAFDGTPMSDALVLHFNRRHKPWKFDQAIGIGLDQPGFIKACGLWYEAYGACLSAMHMRARSR
jgi:lipopolysaccharide biosynthesis glycosyltransferase